MSSDSGLGALWTLIKILLVIFAVTACYTSNLVSNDPDQVFVAVIIWVIVIAGIIVAFMAISYFGGKGQRPAAYPPAYGYPAYGQSTFQQPAPVYPQYSMYAQPGPGVRACRYCDSYLAPNSPICPRCGRLN